MKCTQRTDEKIDEILDSTVMLNTGKKEKHQQLHLSCRILSAEKSICEIWDTKDFKRCESPQVAMGDVMVIFTYNSVTFFSTGICCQRYHRIQ